MPVLGELMHFVEDFRPVQPQWTEEEEEVESDLESMKVGLNAVITGSEMRSH